MSLPLLSNSPTVALSVGADRRLRADLVLSPDTANGLVARTTGLYAKKARRRFPFAVLAPTGIGVFGTVGVTPSAGLSMGSGTTANQTIPWATEQYDPAGLFDLVNFPTRLTVPEACRVFSNVSFQLGAAAATCEAGQILVMRNGTILEGAQTLWAGSKTATPAGPAQVIGSWSGWIDCAAGDYLEVFWRWTAGSPGVGNAAAVWGGGAITT